MRRFSMILRGWTEELTVGTTLMYIVIGEQIEVSDELLRVQRHAKFVIGSRNVDGDKNRRKRKLHRKIMVEMEECPILFPRASFYPIWLSIIKLDNCFQLELRVGKALISERCNYSLLASLFSPIQVSWLL
ncbi:hypothetical protein VNO77_15022 [Canavalia gladiata]|uniref:Uncharacterized protein n=1 Tax=Canavalia gladiata TaxID=3824 RepID=A0AAN9M2B1_CANGL